MPFEVNNFDKSSNFNFTNQFKNFDNNPSVPSVNRGSDGRQLESEINFYNKDSLLIQVYPLHLVEFYISY